MLMSQDQNVKLLLIMTGLIMHIFKALAMTCYEKISAAITVTECLQNLYQRQNLCLRSCRYLYLFIRMCH